MPDTLGQTDIEHDMSSFSNRNITRELNIKRQ